MPELPEVHGYQQYVNSTILHKEILEMECRDERLLKRPIKAFKELLIGNQFTGTQRIGKYLFLETSNQTSLVMHFGMTGRPSYYKDAAQRPKFGHIVLSLVNDFQFAFENKRKFGWWDIAENIEEYRKEHGLSKDARSLSLEEFRENLSNRKTDIKKVIMDQSVCAGVGNWMADEILFQAQVHPEKKLADMDDQQVSNVYKALQDVIETAIDNDAHYDDFPKNYLIHHRKEGGSCPQTGASIQKIKVGGRSTYFSPEWQKK
ncbi:Fpg/Nei family DNA glycosylase [Nonlabens xiamenensis]|uniref:Fpg/Nei family DNA glycosylase n=1 Tax=Nonlabens xiamenensis TaxID=2341043 RepID=UPI000F6111B0|nr:DNA-formamidopyrimidine glycosylase family protein [Nonlabens xiamenensis]